MSLISNISSTNINNTQNTTDKDASINNDLKIKRHKQAPPKKTQEDNQAPEVIVDWEYTITELTNELEKIEKELEELEKNADKYTEEEFKELKINLLEQKNAVNSELTDIKLDYSKKLKGKEEREKISDDAQNNNLKLY